MPLELKMGPVWDTQNAGKPSTCHKSCLISNFLALPGVFPMAIPMLPYSGTGLGLPLKEAKISSQGLLKPDHVPEIMFNLLSSLRVTKYWEMCQRCHGDWVPCRPCHSFRVPCGESHWKLWELATRVLPFSPSSLKPIKPESSPPAGNPQTLTLHHSKDSHPPPLPQRWC